MAGHFKAISGIDPLTINQNIMNEKSAAEFEDAYFTAFSKAYPLREPAVQMKDGHAWVSPEDNGFFDIQVFHPRFNTAHGRPGYFTLDGTRKPVPIKLRKPYTGMLYRHLLPENITLTPCRQTSWY